MKTCKLCGRELTHWAQKETGYCCLQHLQGIDTNRGVIYK